VRVRGSWGVALDDPLQAHAGLGRLDPAWIRPRSTPPRTPRMHAQMVGVAVDDPRKLTRLWAHEALRVFHDRLVSDEDRWVGPGGGRGGAHTAWQTHASPTPTNRRGQVVVGPRGRRG
jgi:hypothetical protein